MFKKLVSLMLALLILFSLGLAQAEPVTIVDMFGRESVITEPVTRIIALTPADCEILCALGCEDTLVGRGTYCDYPASILSVPVVESGAEMNLEQIIALEPQVLLLSDMAHTLEATLALERAGIKVITSSSDGIDGVFASIRIIGKLMGKDAEAEALVKDMQQTFDDIRTRSASSPVQGKTVYFEISPLQWGLWTGGSNTFMDEIAQMCGVKNLFADVDSWAEVSEEQVLARDPDYIVTTTMYYGEGPLPDEEILSRESWADVTAVKTGRVFHAGSDELTRPGPRLKDAAIALYNFFNEHQ